MPAARQLRRGTVTRHNLENALRRILTTTRHRKRFPDRRVLLPIVDAMSIAIDLDTEEEAREQGGVVESDAPGRLSGVQ